VINSFFIHSTAPAPTALASTYHLNRLETSGAESPGHYTSDPSQRPHPHPHPKYCLRLTCNGSLHSKIFGMSPTHFLLTL